MSRKKIGRNDPCPCGSGLKYKKCCLNKIKNPEIMVSPQPLPRIAELTEKTRQQIEKNDLNFQTELGKELMKKLKKALKDAKAKTELPKRFPSDCILYTVKEAEDDLDIQITFDFEEYEKRQQNKKK